MKGTGTYTTPGGHPNHNVRMLTPTVMDLRQVIDYLVKPHCYKIGKLHFHHAFKSFQA